MTASTNGRGARGAIAAAYLADVAERDKLFVDADAADVRARPATAAPFERARA